jgi:dihydrolipoamide dehydrogenase
MYDLIIIGGGPAGYNAAERAAHGGLKVLLAEKKALGGVCLNEGCIPTKTLLHSAKIYDYAKHGEDYGVKFTGAEINHEFVVGRKNRVVKTLVSGVAGKLKKAGVEVITGQAVIKNKNNAGFTIEINGNLYSGKYLLICAGSEAAVPPIPGLKDGLESGFCVTSREILDLKEAPKRLVVIGGGVIGLEFASYFSSIGARVTVIEMLDKIGGMIDGEIADILYKNYVKQGVEFILGAKVTNITDTGVMYEANGENFKIDAFIENFDKILIAIGRRAASSGLGLENINILTERGSVVTDEYGRTNIANVYAAGDINGKSMLAHTAYREGEVCVNNILGKKDKINYSAIPAVIYTNPEVAGVGETAESVKAKNIKAGVHSFSLKYSGRYVAENEKGDGILKIIADENNIIIGLHIIGSYASEIIYGAAMMLETKMRVEDVQKFVFPHPTVCEVIREGCFMI